MISYVSQGKDEILEKFYIMLKYTRKQYYYSLQYHDVLLPIPSYGLDENLKTDDDIKYVSCFRDIAGAYSNTNAQIKAHILDIDTLISQKCFRQPKLKVFSDDELRSMYLESLDALLKDGDVRRKIVHSYSKSRRLTVKEKLKLLQPVVYVVQRLILENRNYHDVLDWVQYRLALERWLHAVGNHDTKLLEQTRLVNEDVLTVILGTYDFKQKVYRIITTGFFVLCFLLCIFLFLMRRKVDEEIPNKI